MKWIIENWIAKDEYEKMNEYLQKIKETDKTSSGASNMKTNDFLRLLNNHIVRLNYSTSVYSRCLLIFTAAIFFLTLVLIFK